MQRTAHHESTTELIRFLSDSATYPGNPSVELVETHISLVFLAGNDVYKLKKPVKFDFLDFSTVEHRKSACENELRLNRRMAESVYLDVIPIRRKLNGKLTLGGSEHDEVVDWLVHMRRLREDRTLAARFLQTDPDQVAVDIQETARFLAAFYAAQAPAMVRTDAFRQHMREHIEENQSLLTEYATSEHDRDLIQRIHTSQLRFLYTHRDIIDARVLDGRIVDGHGDLRPDHIYIYKSPLVIDCIEFNRDYRTNDVIDELAFLAVCSDRLGQPQVGESLFSQYQQVSNDHCDPQLIAFYKSYRACVRAKVAVLRGQQQDGLACGESACKVQEYLQLARRYIESLNPPLVLMVGGLMGSGKSTLARELRTRLSAELVSSDDVRLPSPPEQEYVKSDFSKGKYAPSQRLANYRRMIEIARQLAPRNKAFIFDGTFTKKASRQLVADFAESIGARLLQVECECPREEALTRRPSKPSR
jgi:aminoglycoside phosphotransferase family enzyme/predicted kinase